MASWSVSGDIWPDTPTFTCLDARLHQQINYLRKLRDRYPAGATQPLQTPPATVDHLFVTYANQGEIPLAYLDGEYVINEVQYDPTLLHDNHGQSSKGITFTQALASIHRQTSPLAADICQITHPPLGASQNHDR